MTNKSQKVDETTNMIDDGIKSINKVLVRDPRGTIEVSTPIGRNVETGKMEFVKIKHSEKDVPPEEVVRYTGSMLMDAHSSLSVTVEINGQREIVVFDRTYTHGNKKYSICAWVPKKTIMAGVLYEKKINQQSHQPVAVLKKLPGTSPAMPMFQIIGGKEADYRDCKRMFERTWLRKGSVGEDDELLNRFMYDSIEAIPEEIAR